MTQAQSDAEQCGLIPEENNSWFFAQHLSAYAFARPRVSGSRVLEVGFGDGYGAAYLAEAAREVVAVDVTAGNIPRARSKYPRPNLSFQEFDGLRLPFPDASGDPAEGGFSSGDDARPAPIGGAQDFPALEEMGSAGGRLLPGDHGPRLRRHPEDPLLLGPHRCLRKIAANWVL